MTENVIGYLATIAYGAATGTSLPAYASDSYTVIPDVENIVPPSASREKSEKYVLDQLASKKFVGSITYSEATGTALRAFDSAAQDQMENDVNAGTPVRRNWRISLPNLANQIFYFAGYASKFEFSDIKNQDVMEFHFEIVVDGAVTIVR